MAIMTRKVKLVAGEDEWKNLDPLKRIYLVSQEISTCREKYKRS
jgi:hypothetical protein